jgi:uncharacterized membrane protein YedE/YeeE
MDFILNPWPWYVAGPLMALVMILLVYFGKTFGMSSNLRTMCTMLGAGKFSDFFKIDWKAQSWNLMVVLGAIVGGYIAVNFLSNDTIMALNPKTISELNALGFRNPGSTLVPNEFFEFVSMSAKSLIILIIGGLLVGFGTRYAGGCTSGHAITGLSSLQKPSLIAVIGFFIGGLIMTNILLPLIF